MKHSRIFPVDTAIRHLGLPGWAQPLPGSAAAGVSERQGPGHVRLLIALNVVSIALALLLLGGLFLSWSLNAELDAVRKELAGLQQFEKRILARVDTMNNGVQHRLSRIDQRLGAIGSDIGLVTKGHRDPAATVESIATMIRNDGTYFGSVTAELLLRPELSEPASQRFVPSPSSPGPLAGQGGRTEEQASLFTRVTTEDGKVRYEIRR